jgi:hypothetical protein
MCSRLIFKIIISPVFGKENTSTKNFQQSRHIGMKIENSIRILLLMMSLR